MRRPERQIAGGGQGADNPPMYTAEWVRQAIRGEVTGKDASAARLLAMTHGERPGIEEAIAQAINAWVDSGADPASPTYWWDCVGASRDALRSWPSRSVDAPSRFYALDPEVPGGLGRNTELVLRSGSYPLVERLHFEFGAGRFEDDLFTCHPVYLVRRPLAESLHRSELTGFTLSRDVEVSADDNVRDLEPGWQAPEVEWLKVSGAPGTDDLGLTDDALLVVSEAALRLLRLHAVDRCGVRPFGGC